MLMEPSQRKLVSFLIRLLDTFLRQVSSRCHEAMDLVVKRVDLMWHFQVLLEACDGLFVFVLAGKELNRNGDVGGVVGVDLECCEMLELDRVKCGVSRTTVP